MGSDKQPMNFKPVLPASFVFLKFEVPKSTPQKPSNCSWQTYVFKIQKIRGKRLDFKKKSMDFSMMDDFSGSSFWKF